MIGTERNGELLSKTTPLSLVVFTRLKILSKQLPICYEYKYEHTKICTFQMLLSLILEEAMKD